MRSFIIMDSMYYKEKQQTLKQNEIEVFQRYLSEQASREEEKMIEALLQKGETDITLKQILEKEWMELSKIPHEQNATVERIHGYILQNIIEDLKQNQSTFFRQVISFYAKAAAILFIPFLLASLAGFYFLSHNKTSLNVADIQVEQKEEIFTNTVTAPYGSRVSFILPDNTVGMLNSGSKLTYSIPFNDNRSISLEGEAWFEVKRDQNHPFVITAGNSSVKVLGTSFNINAYPVEDYIEVVLGKGKVEFKGNPNDSATTIYPSERLIYKNGNTNKDITDPLKYSGWKDGKLIFRGDPMTEVARRLERWYNVKVNIANKELEHYSFRGTFIDDSLEEVLNLLAMTSPISYKISPRKLLPNGTYDKQTITINLRTKN